VTSKGVTITHPVTDADKFIGSRVSFLFYPGWEEPERMTGWLHGVSRSDPTDQDQMTWLHISDEETLADGEDGRGLGGYAADSFDVL
jgi:hypothetical protein